VGAVRVGVIGSANVVWDLAPHDVSILMNLLGSAPHMVSAEGGARVPVELPAPAAVQVQ
jgi:hypothetical protein